MARRAGKISGRRAQGNQRRERLSFAELMSQANRRAHEQANRRSGRRELKWVRAAIAAEAAAGAPSGAPIEWMRRLGRWVAALALLPLTWVTTWTFLSRFSHAAVERGFWQTVEFMYFALGAVLMASWLWSGILQKFFLYLYVLGHELTHAMFVLVCRGRVTDIHVSAEGGYITTNKTNLLIALSPYFVPFWSVVVALAHAAARLLADLPPAWDPVFYAAMGASWTFHMIWTLWMIPRDQPDLRENGTLLSLVVIYQANLLVLVLLLCVAAESPLGDAREFVREWLRHAATWSDAFLRGVSRLVTEWRASWRL